MYSNERYTKKKIELIQAQRTTKKTHIKEQWIFFGIVQLKTVFLKGAHIAQQCNGKQQRECDVMQCNVMQWWECGWFYEAWLCSIFIILAARLLYYSRIFRFNVENKHHLLALNFCYQIIYRTSSYKHTDRDLVATKYTAYRHLPSRQPSKQASRRAGRQAGVRTDVQRGREYTEQIKQAFGLCFIDVIIAARYHFECEWRDRVIASRRSLFAIERTTHTYIGYVCKLQTTKKRYRAFKWSHKNQKTSKN